MADAPNYKVVDQERDTAIGVTGKVERGYRVYFTVTGISNVFDVFVPDTHYGEEQARTLIQHEADRILAVHNIGS